MYDFDDNDYGAAFEGYFAAGIDNELAEYFYTGTVDGEVA